MSRFKQQFSSTIPALPFDQCWAKTDVSGKPGLSVLDHCRVVGYVAKALLSFLPSPVIDRIGDNPVLAASLHDVGKVSPGFQLKYFRDVLAQLGNPLAKCYAGFDDNHASVGELTLNSVYGNEEKPPAVAQVAGAHHGRRRLNMQNTDLDYFAEGDDWPRQRRNLINALEAEFGLLGRQPRDNLSIVLLTGLVCVADWIGSDESFFNPATLPVNSDIAGMAENAVRLCGWQSLDLCPNLTFEDVFDFPPYAMQRDTIDRIDKPGVYVLEAPTGMGKTEAALFAAYRLMANGQAAGFYFGLPTRLTSDRIHLRTNHFITRISRKPDQARLAHGKAWLSRLKLENGPADWRNQESHPETWFNPGKRALLYPYAVGTIDQSLLGILNVRHFFLRLFGLAGKVVILDEVHTYDIFTGTHLDTLVNFLRQLDCTVIILTATLTRQRRNALLRFENNFDDQGQDHYPLLTMSNQDGCTFIEPAPPESRAIKVDMHSWSNLEVAENAVAKAQTGACVLCIANTVAQAQTWYCAIMAERPDEAFEVGLLHSKFIGDHRAAKEDYWMRKLGPNGDRPQGCILVATQVVEQSVDIDVDFMITELAPTDMLIQRLGRLWRHNRTERPLSKPALVVVTKTPLPADVDPDQLCEMLGIANTYVYSPYVLCRTHAVWQDFNGKHLILPDKVRELLHQTYQPLTNEPITWQILRRQQEEKSERLLRRAIAFEIGNSGIPVGRDDEQAATRYNDRPMRHVLLIQRFSDERAWVEVELLSGEILRVPKFGFDIHIAARLCNNTIELPVYALPQTSSYSWLQKSVGKSALILVCHDDGCLRHEGSDTGFAYDEQKGLMRNQSDNGKKTCKTTIMDGNYLPYSDFETEVFINESCDW